MSETMREPIRPKVYWANAMFSAADREFNAKCAEVLRKAGYRVYLPQESAINRETSPYAEDIFRVDTAEILNSDILVACIDQETIDPGVACEIGVAFAGGIPIIGLYTDIRQYREGPSRMYKNPYVIGAIKTLGKIVSNVDELLRAIPECLSRRFKKLSENDIRGHFNKIAHQYPGFIKLLESWYDPPWSVGQIVEPWFQRIKPKRLIEFGCGNGDLAKSMLQRHPNLTYVGYDFSSEMVRMARSKIRSAFCTFTTSWSVVKEKSKQQAFDAALISFVLHDLPDPLKVLKELNKILRTEASLLVVDLSTEDLPKLTDLLRKKLARPLCLPDNRLSPSSLNVWAEKSGFIVTECGFAMPIVRFPDKDAIARYLTIFGIYKGMDLPLGLQFMNPVTLSEEIGKILNELSYPFIDQRGFIVSVLQKR